MGACNDPERSSIRLFFCSDDEKADETEQKKHNQKFDIIGESEDIFFKEGDVITCELESQTHGVKVVKGAIKMNAEDLIKPCVRWKRFTYESKKTKDELDFLWTIKVNDDKRERDITVRTKRSRGSRLRDCICIDCSRGEYAY